MTTTRRRYRLTLDATLALDDERLPDVVELVKARVNEMLGRMEHHDDVRILLVHTCEVKETP